MRAQMALGGGRMTKGTARPRTITSHRKMTMPPKRSGMTILAGRRRSGASGSVTLSRLTATQASIQASTNQRPEAAGRRQPGETGEIAAPGKRGDAAQRRGGDAGGDEAADEHDEIADRGDAAHEAGEDGDRDHAAPRGWPLEPSASR